MSMRPTALEVRRQSGGSRQPRGSHGLRLVASLLVPFAVVSSLSSVSQADANPTVDILVIHATNCPTPPPKDPRITSELPLKYSCHTVKTADTQAMVKGAAKMVALPTGRAFQLIYQEPTADGRYKMSAAINDAPNGATFAKLADITAEPRRQFFVGGWDYLGGKLVVAVTVKK